MTDLEIKQRRPKSAKRRITSSVTLFVFGPGLAIPGFFFQEACINAEASLEKQRPGWFDFSEAVGIGFAEFLRSSDSTSASPSSSAVASSC